MRTARTVVPAVVGVVVVAVAVESRTKAGQSGRAHNYYTPGSDASKLYVCDIRCDHKSRARRLGVRDGFGGVGGAGQRELRARVALAPSVSELFRAQFAVRFPLAQLGHTSLNQRAHGGAPGVGTDPENAPPKHFSQ